MHRALEPDRNDVGLPLPRLAFRRAGQSAERPFCRRSCADRGERQLVFSFLVRRLKWLARIPGAPQVFDAILGVATAVFSPNRLRAMSTIESTVCTWSGMRAGIHR